MITENCSPAVKNNIEGSCFTVSDVNNLKQKYNKTYKNNKLGTRKNGKKIIEELGRRLSCTRESCITEKLGMGDRNFAPKMPRSWLKNESEWLSTPEFTDIFRKYEEANPDFLFLGPAASDYEYKMMDGQCEINDLCSLDVRRLPKRIKKIGVVFNLDKHNEPGSHWVSMYISVKKKTVYYFDSAGSKILPSIYALYKQIHKQDSSYKYVDNYPFVHQYGNNECGMYSIFFLITMIYTEDYSLFTKRKWKDKTMNALRKKVFNR
jgi:hypothetical protein